MYFTHLEKTNHNTILVADNNIVCKYNVVTKELTTHLKFPDDRKINCTNYAGYKHVELFFSGTKPIQVFYEGKFVKELNQTIPQRIESGGLMNASRGVEYYRNICYFIDVNAKLYSCDMNQIKTLIEEEKVNQIPEVPNNLVDRVSCIAYAKTKKQLYYSNLTSQIVKYGTTVGCQFPESQKVSYMEASHGVLAASTYMTKSGGQSGAITMSYHVLSQDKLEVLARSFIKEGDYYHRHQILKLALVNVRQGLLMIGLPNYESCDLLLANRKVISPIFIDKPLAQVCHWSMVAISTMYSTNIYFGSVQGIYKLTLKV